MVWFIAYIRCNFRNLRIFAFCLVLSIGFGLFFMHFNDGITSDPRDGPVLPGACPLSNREVFKSKGNQSHPQLGGHYKPQDCIARAVVAIVVPCRKREEHRKIFLQHMHNFLQNQQLEYAIYLVESAPPTKFNRGILANIGVQYAMNSGIDFSCVVIHDVNLVPVDIRNLYVCSDNPRHMSSASSKFKYRLPYPSYIGGVMSFTPNQFRYINGFSNMYFDSGAENDDMRLRISKARYELERVPSDIGVYKAIEQLYNKDIVGSVEPESIIKEMKDDEKNESQIPSRSKHLYHAGQNQARDGLNSLKYTLLSVETKPQYTWLYVHINQSDDQTKPVLSFFSKDILMNWSCVFSHFLCKS